MALTLLLPTPSFVNAFSCKDQSTAQGVALVRFCHIRNTSGCQVSHSHGHQHHHSALLFLSIPLFFNALSFFLCFISNLSDSFTINSATDFYHKGFETPFFSRSFSFFQLPHFINSSLPAHDRMTAQQIDNYFRQELIYKRNERMARRVSALLQRNPNQTYFFAFGAGKTLRHSRNSHNDL